MPKCHNCETEKTPMWRKTLDTETKAVLTLCNACGIYYKTKGCHRPRLLISKRNILSLSELFDKISKEDEEKANQIASNDVIADKKPKVLVKNDIKLEDLNIIRCSNCENINTSIWRRDDNGKSICNACGLFYKKKGYHRKVKKSNEDMFLSIDENLIRFNKIKRRNRSASTSSDSQISIKKTRPSPEIRNDSSSSSSSSSFSFIAAPTSEHKPKLEPSPETPILLNNSTRSFSISSTESQSPDLVKYDIGNYRYDSFKPEHGTDFSYTLPRIATPTNPIKLPPISTILNIHK